MKNNKITKLTALSETKYLSLFDAEYKNKKGNTKHWIIASRKCYETLKDQYFQDKKENMDAVVIAAIHKENKKLVLIKQFRVPLNDFIYELPAGLIDNNESIEIAVARELKEETGLSLLEIDREKTKKGVYVSAGMTDESVALVYCTCIGEITNKYLEDDEDIEAILVSRSEAEELLKKDVKMDIKAYMLLQSFVSSQ
jgi:NTP pyrophosphohydrolases including oxidative damage repair enzymes